MSLSIERQRVAVALETARSDLLAERNAAGHWVGDLSSSPLATATAISALVISEQYGSLEQHGRKADQLFDADQIFQSDLSELIVQSLHWLASQQNEDGGWGDTDRSRSNIATTLLVTAAYHLTGVPAKYSGLLERAEAYMARSGGVAALRKQYGRDKTLTAPILVNCALAGLVPWNEAPPLPFELAVFPQSWRRALKLPVVSFAIPALVAIGLAVFHHRRPFNPVNRAIRSLSRARALKIVEQLQPESGGFLESTPLTSFVVMSLASVGLAEHAIVRRGVEFLLASVRSDGSWPVDTNLAITNTSQAMIALGRWTSDAGGEFSRGQETGNGRRDSTRIGHNGASAARHGMEPCVDWLLRCQIHEPHPSTGASPGGWAWTDLSGGVPNVDNTAGALVALCRVYDRTDSDLRRRIERAAKSGMQWLLSLQNRDGGWPTFSRRPTYGRCWGHLHYDRSGSELTAAAVQALSLCKRHMPAAVHGRDALSQFDNALRQGIAYLQEHQREDGSWVPLWFGNQQNPDDENPVYGTSRVLIALADLGYQTSDMARRGCEWLGRVQHASGGWGPITQRPSPVASTVTKRSRGAPTTKRASNVDKKIENDVESHATGPSVEETALAVTALFRLGATSTSLQHAAQQGLAWLVEAVENGRHTEPAPIGFYFAKLWYYERLYPRIFAAEALEVAHSTFSTAERLRNHQLAAPLPSASY